MVTVYAITDNKVEEITFEKETAKFCVNRICNGRKYIKGWISARETWRYPKGAERKLKCKRNDSLCGGTVIYGGDKRLFRAGLYREYWYPHDDTDKWQEVPNPELTQENEINNTDGKRKQIGGNHYAGHNNGGNTDYYKLPEGATELQDIIEHKKMHWNIANMFKALYRMGQQDHSSIERDLNKIEYFLKRHKELLRKDML